MGFLKDIFKKKQPNAQENIDVNAHENIDAIIALNELIDKQYLRPLDPYTNIDFKSKGSYVLGDDIRTDAGSSGEDWKARIIKKFMRPEGERYYAGEAESFDRSLAETLAGQQSELTQMFSPADSLQSSIVAELLKQRKLFEE